MKHSILIFLLFLFLNSYCMEDLSGIQEPSFEIEGFHVTQYRMGKVLINQTCDETGKILKYSGTISQENKFGIILEHNAALATFNTMMTLRETEKQFLAQKAARKPAQG